MKLIRNLGLGAFVALLSIAIIAQPTFAHTAEEAARCEKAETRLKTQVSSIQTLRETRIKSYNTILTRTDSLIKSADEKGYDTQKLETARLAVQTALDSYTTNATNFETALTSVQTEICGHEEAKLANALATARTNLVTLRTSSAAVKSAASTQLVPEIKAYATWLHDQTTTTPKQPNAAETH